MNNYTTKSPSNNRSIWKEVSKSNPCPICGKPDWCSASENGDAALCRRTDFAPPGWKEIKKSSDGYPIYAMETEKQYQPYSHRPRKIHNSKKNNVILKPVIPEGELKLVKLPEPATDSPKPKLKRDYKERRDVNSIEYWYSQTQWVDRWEWANPDKPKGREKTFKQHYYFTDPDGVKWDKLGKGDSPWSAYRLDEALVLINQITGTAVLLLPEGEKCVEALREIGLAAITFQGSSWGKDSEVVIQQLARIPNLVLGLLPDYDSAGEKKANILQAQCDRAKLPSLILDLKQVYPNLQEKEDCVEAIAAMGSEEFIRRLEEEIHRAVNQKATQDEVTQADEEIDEDTDLDRKLKLDIQLLIKEADPIRRLRLRSEICSFYRIAGKDLENVVATIKRSQSAKQTRAYSFDELLELETEALNWLIPELLPVGETVILSASPKAGKTLLAIDAAFAVATGESSFLGELTKPGKVLLVEADESLTSTRAKLLKRGFRKGDNLQVLPVWDISQMDKLETMLEDFRPDLVIVDSLRRIHHGSTISENSAEFADTIYTLKELFNRYKASGILIHHSNKDKDAMGVGKLRGSSAIAGAVWGTWQLDHIPRPDPNNKKKLIIDPKDPRRVLSVYARDTEGQTMRIELDLENNSWIREQAEEDAEAKTLTQRILHLLGKNSHLPGLSGKEIIELLEEGKAVYTALNRMTNKLLISCHPAPGDRRVNLYSLPKVDVPVDLRDSPPPTPTVPIVDYQAETYTEQGLDNSQQISHHPLEISHHLETENTPADFSNPDSETVPEIVITLDAQGGGEGVECANSNNSEEEKTDLKVCECVEDLVLVDSVEGLLEVVKQHGRAICTEAVQYLDDECSRRVKKLQIQLKKQLGNHYQELPA